MFKVGFYEKEITPPLGSHIPGYFNERPGSDVKDRLYAKAMVVDNGKEKVAIIAVDGCSMNNDCVAMVKDRVTEFIGIKPENILFAYTHTHTGIPRYNFSKSERTDKNQEYYWEVFSKLMADCAILAYYRLAESELYFGKGEVVGISFCRDYLMKNGTPQTNPPRCSEDIIGPAGETDNSLPVLFVKDAQGTPKGALISFACHPDCVSGTEYTGDYISILSKELKKTYGEEFVTVFLQGTSGNINHFDVSKESDAPDHYVMMGKLIAGEALKVIAKAEKVEDDTLISKLETVNYKRMEIPEEKIAKAKHVIETVKEIEGVKIAADGSDPDQYALAMSKKLIDFLENSPDSYDVPLQFIKIGDVKLYIFHSEIFCTYGLNIRAKAGTEKCFVTTLGNGSYGYLPTSDLIYDTIYESRPGTFRFNPETGNQMVEKLLEMGK